MNLSSVVGIVVGIILIVFGIVIGGDITRYVDPAGILIVFGGVISAIMVAYSFEQLKEAIPKMKDAFVKPDIDLEKDAEKIIELANTARREGLLALDGEDFGDDFMQKGMELVIDGTDPELVKDILEAETVLVEEKDGLAVKVLLSASSFSPAFGMVGTLIGLINMLAFLSDVDTLGPSMATALVTTFYGVILANMFFTPLANKMRTASELRQTRLAMIMEGILSIQNGENPRIIKEKLDAFIPERADKRKTINAEGADLTDEKETITG
jgi:chemotaxis protein MotA